MSIRIASLADLPEVNAQIQRADRVMVDTEFHAERRYFPVLYLLQVHVEDGDTWLLDPLVDDAIVAGVAEKLRQTPWIVHAGQQDIRILQRVLGGVPDTILDTQIAAGFAGSRFPCGYADLVQQYLIRQLDKSSTLSDWSQRPLTEAQVHYAAGDVQLLPELWDRIAEQVEARGWMDLCGQACADARGAAVDPGEDESWRELQATGVMTGPQLAALQGLAQWRHDLAVAQNQPVRSILSDGLMLEIARRTPLTLDSLRANRRFPKALVRRHGAALLDVVGRAKGRPDWGWPQVIRPNTADFRRLAWLRCFAASESARTGFALRLVLPDALLQTLVLAHPASRDAVRAVLGPWRDTLCGARLWACLAGEVTLRLSADDVLQTGSSD